MTKTTNTWFQCAECPVESDLYYTIQRQGKEIKVCPECFKRITQGLKIKSGEELQFKMNLDLP